MARAYIGTSGWQYGGWKGLFYPQTLPQKDWLRYYSKYFDTVEVNSTFYRQTRASTFKKWLAETARDFIFAVKGSRFITHIKRLGDAGDAVKLFFENAGVLEERKGPHVVLWQLPPSLKSNTQRLREFVKLLPKSFRHAFEFRHKTWLRDDTWKTLRGAPVECSAVLQDWRDWPVLPEPVGKFVYIRLHGRERLYASNYSDEELRKWAIRIKGWLKKKLDVYVYFNNDAEGYAVPNARRLRELLGE